MYIYHIYMLNTYTIYIYSYNNISNNASLDLIYVIYIMLLKIISVNALHIPYTYSYTI